MESDSLTGKRLFVLDVHGILYQVFHTMREMSGPKGQPTGAAFGLVRDVMNILLKFKPDYVFCAFDMPGKTFRNDLYPLYKANRSAMPDDLRPQTVFARRLLDALCIARLEKENYEADDLLATVARRVVEAGGDAVLVTSDKDARQLISEHVSLYNLRKESFYTAAELLADWGIRPDQVVDFQTMVGDSTDNVPGIPLIGPKSATALLQQYDTLENVFAHTGDLKGKKKENIENGREQAALTRKLVRLDDRVPIEIDWEKARLHGVDADRLHEIFKELGFRSLTPKIAELVQAFGTCTAEPSEQIAESLLEIKPKTDRSLFDDLPPEPLPTPAAEIDAQNNGEEKTSAADYDPFISIADENAPITEKLFAALRRPSAPPPKLPDIGPFDPAAVTYHLVDTPEKFGDFLTRLKEHKIFSVDLETVDCQGSSKVRPRFAKIVGLAFCFDALNGWYLPIRGPQESRLLPEQETLDALRPILESPEYRKIGQNIKFDRIVFQNAGIKLRGSLFDTMVADYLLHAGEQRHNLDELAENYLGHQTIKISELIGVGKNQKKMSEIPTETVAEYAGEDAVIPWRLYPILLAELERRPGLLRLLTELEMPLIDVLVEMESNGIAIDRTHFDKLAEIFSAKIDEIETQIRDLARDADPDPAFAASFNINSPQQLQRILFDDLKLPIVKKTKTGRSTDYEVLEQLAEIHPLPAKLIEHRTAVKLKGTYIDPIPELVHPITGRIHASFNQVVTATGRLSSSDPNLQNIPVRSEEGKLIRKGFVPDSSLGFDTLLSCDYSQIELRVLTHFSKDENLTRAFENDFDIHSAVAAELFDTTLDQVDSDMRRVAKTVNFGLVYGQSAFGLAKTLGISQSEAADYIRRFFKTYPGIHLFLDRVLEECRDTGEVETILGRRRQIEGVRGARGDKPLNMAERTAINTVIQGSAADLMKLAMVNVSRKLAEINEDAANGFFSSPPAISAALPSVPSIVPAKPIQAKTLFDEQPGDESETPESHSAFFRTPDVPRDRGRLLLQIHDELVLETTAGYAPELARIVQKEMELGQPLSVPLKIDAEIGTTWGG